VNSFISKEYNMRYYAIVLIAVMAPAILAQSPSDRHYGEFVIGADFVRPSTPMPYPNRHGIPDITPAWPSFVRDAQTGLTEPLNSVVTDMPWERWLQLTDLGVEFAGTVLHRDAMTPPTENRPQRVLQAAAANHIDLGIVDYSLPDGIHAYAGLTRLHLQLESSYDMENTHSLLVTNDVFSNLYGGRYDLSRYPLQRGGENAVQYSGTNTTVMQGHLCRRTGLAADHQTNLKNGGEYYISLSLFYDPNIQIPGQGIPPDNTIIFRLRIYDGGTVINELVLRGTDFNGVNGYAEVLMGIRRFERNAGTFSITDLTPLTVNPNGDNRDLARIDLGLPETALYYELEYMPSGERWPVIDVDALVLSEGKAFALFNPADPRLHVEWLSLNRPIDILTDRIALLCQGTPSARIVFFPESDEVSGNIGSIKFVADALSVGGSIPFMYGSAQMGPNSYNYFLNAARACIQGMYRYPYLTFRDATTYAAEPEDAGYYDEHFPPSNPDPGWGIQNMINRYRDYAERRVQNNVFSDWMPAIQNGSYGFADGSPSGQPPTDTEWLREPTTREIRCAVNLALAYGAHGILYYNFSSVQGVDNSSQESEGVRGFLNADHTPRTMDRYGHNKWDSIRTFNHDYLREMGDTLYNLRWVAGYSVQNDNTVGALGNLVSCVMAEQQDIAIDPADETYVEVSEFTLIVSGADVGLHYLFVVNKRPREGDHRHITVKLRPYGAAQWKVTNVLTGDIWIVRGDENPDFITHEHGFTEYYEPGEAHLFRLEPMAGETIDFNPVVVPPPTCPMRSIYIEPAATLRLKSTDVVLFGPGHGLFCDGTLHASYTQFIPCDPEQQWRGVFARDGGTVNLEHVLVHNASVVAGSGGTANLDEGCEIWGVHCALWNIEGTLHSTATASYDVNNHLIHVGSSMSELKLDHAFGLPYLPTTAVSVFTNGDRVRIDECEFEGFWRSIYAFEGTVLGDVDTSIPVDGGNNSLRSSDCGLLALEHGWIMLGSTTSPSGGVIGLNEIIVSDPEGVLAETDAMSWILARYCWWEPADWSYIIPPLINVIGNVEYLPALQSDPIPFTGPGRASFAEIPVMNKSRTSMPPPAIRDQILSALAQGNHGTLRHIIGQFLRTPDAATADFGLLRLMHRSLRDIGARGGVDSLLTLCLARPDLDSKLLAADIAAADSLYIDALAVLNAYSFAGSPALLKRALIRKSLLYPRTRLGGYRDGLLALDSLRGMNDSLLLRFIDLYPLLYSRLSRPQSSSIPKWAVQALIDRALPTGIDVWPNYPNPFSDVTSFTFKLGEATHVRLAIYDAMGREVAVVTDADYDRGVHSAVLRAGALPSGLYFSRLTTDKGVTQRKMMLMR
jgi:hypothetical protein